MTARAPLPAARRGGPPARPGGGLPLRSAGLLAWVPPGRAFAVSGRLLHLQVAVALAATALLALVFVAYAVTQAEPRFLLLAAPTAATAAGAGVLVERWLRRAARQSPSADDDPHVQAALEARQRRAAARRLAETDPALARDLRIGRPDLAHSYDDGGLVDVNSAPAPVLVGGLDLTVEEAARVVRVRTQVGGFRSADDLVALAGLEQPRLDRVADRVVVIE